MDSEVSRDDSSRARKRALLVLQVLCTLGAFAYLIHITPMASLLAAFRRAPLWRIPAALLTLLTLLFLGAVRWLLLLGAYGAEQRPPLLHLYRLQLVGLFYNMMPGAVGGDVVRAVVTRDAFGARGLGAGLAVVLIERVLGLLALVVLIVSVLAVHPIASLHLPKTMLALGLCGGIAALVGVALGRRAAPWLPGKLGQLAASLPELVSFGLLATALVVSVINQMLVGAVGHLLISALAPQITLLDSFVLSPLSFATIFFPLTVAGAGTRDAAMVGLYGLLNVPRADALSASLQILFCYVLVAAAGGLLSVLSPLDSGFAPARAARQ